jgi:threonine dehydratase
MVIGDRPGALADLLATVAAESANVLEVSHHRAGVLHGVDEVEVLLTLETRSADHRQAVVDALRAAGHHPEALA